MKIMEILKMVVEKYTIRKWMDLAKAYTKYNAT